MYHKNTLPLDGCPIVNNLENLYELIFFQKYLIAAQRRTYFQNGNCSRFYQRSLSYVLVDLFIAQTNFGLRPKYESFLQVQIEAASLKKKKKPDLGDKSSLKWGSAVPQWGSSVWVPLTHCTNGAAEGNCPHWTVLWLFHFSLLTGLGCWGAVCVVSTTLHDFHSGHLVTVLLHWGGHTAQQ